MCGIAGAIATTEIPGLGDQVRAMADAIIHRGPDDFGYFASGISAERPTQDPGGLGPRRVVFAHRRLSILDLSEAARGPMVTRGGRVFMTYNGEVYNFGELKRELQSEGVRFKTTSDTEVVLEAYARWGVDSFRRLRGIFALAIADLDEGKAYLVRDHLGVKPLYVTRDRGVWCFASELKAILARPGFRAEPDYAAIRKYLHLLWIPGKETGIRDVWKLQPGSWLEIDLRTGEAATRRFWDLLERTWDRDPISAERQVEELRALLADAVGDELVSDVPLGAFLSGGLDSTLVAALMKSSGKMGNRPLRTYSVGYSKKDLAFDIVADDLPFARQASAALGTENTEILLKPDVARLLPAIVRSLDEPIGDPAAISSHLICEAARKKLTVMLSGMGGDELFGGYPRQRALMLGMHYRRFPKLARQVAERVTERLPGAGQGMTARLGRAAKKFIAAADRDPFNHYVAMETYFDSDLQRRVLAPAGPLARAADPVGEEYATYQTAIARAVGPDPLKQVIALDLLTYLPSLNLAYTDRTSMANSIEVRVPLLDVKLVEWAIRRESQHLIRRVGHKLEGKWILKSAAEGLIPREIIWRRKAGFGAPVRSWLRNDLAETVEDLLGDASVRRRGWLDPVGVRSVREDFMSGRKDYSLQLWMLISLELWARQFLDGRKAA